MKHFETGRILAPAWALALVAMAGCASSPAVPDDPLPPLLVHVTAAGGWASACPGKTDAERAQIARSKLAVSPDFTERLDRQFPPGSPEAILQSELTHEGFEVQAACATDPTVHWAAFYREGHGFLAYSTRATVFWKIDDDGKIVWTKGFVSYIGL